jgi:hypothetical protein
MCARSSSGFLLAGLLPLLASCAPSLSTFQTAAVAPKGHSAVAAGFEGSIPIGPLIDAIDTAKTVSDKARSNQALTSQEKWQALDASMQLLLSPPSVGYHFAFAYAPLDRWEVSLRYAGSALRLGTRYQLLDRASGPFDMSIGFGASRFTYAVPISDYVPILKMDDFTRWQVDVPVLIGMQNQWFRTWIGPRFLATFFDAALRLDLQVEEPVLASMSGRAYYVGGQGGVGFGYRWIFVAFELTITEMFGSARFNAPVVTDSPTHSVDLSGLVIYPSLGLMGEF